MGKRKITILDAAVVAVAEISFFIESKGLPATTKKFVDEAFPFFEKLADEKILHRPCKTEEWKLLNYRCVNFRKKYVVGFLVTGGGIIICDFVVAKTLK